MARILIIDEALELRVALTRFLAALGHNVVAFDSHDEVLGIGRKVGVPNRVNLVILEVLAAGPNTLQVIAELKEALPGMKLLITAHPEAPAALYGPKLLAQAFGATAALLKPFTAAELQSTIELILAPPDTDTPRRRPPN